MTWLKNLLVFWLYSTTVMGFLFIMGLPFWIILYLAFWAIQ